MSTLVALGLANAVCAAFLAVPAYLVSRYGRRPALAHALWLLVLLKLITPPVVRPGLAWLPAAREASPVRALPSMRVVEPVVFVQAPVDTVVPQSGPMNGLSREPQKVVLTMTKPKATVEVAPPRPEPPAESAPVIAPPPAIDRGEALLRFLLLVWVCGAVVCLARALYYVLRFHRLLRHAQLAPIEVQEQADALAKELGLSRAPPIWLVPGPLPPMVWGVGRVRILFPAGLHDRLGTQERGSLLLHELAHVARRDHWVRVLELLAATLFWWYPLTWLARKQLHDREEECCDAWAAAGAIPARIYAGAILETVDFLAEARPRVPAMASALSGMRSLKERLTLILTSEVPRRLTGSTRLALIGLAAAVLPLLPTLVQAKREPAAAPPVAETAPDVEPTTFAQSAVNLLAPLDDVYSVAFAADGKRVAAGVGERDRPGVVEIFDVGTRKSLWRKMEARGVASVAFSSDSKQLAWSGWFGQAVVSDSERYRERFRLDLNDRNGRLSYSRDGKWLAVATENRGLRLHEVGTGKLAYSFARNVVDYYCVGFSPDSTLLGAGGGYFRENTEPNNVALIFDVRTKKQLATLEGHVRAVIGLAFAPKNELIATASADNTVRVWDGKSFKLRSVLKGHTNAVKGVAFSPDSKLLATGSWDGSIRFWDAWQGTQLAQLNGHPGSVREIAFSPDGQLLVSGGSQRTVKLWSVADRKEIATLRQDRPVAGPSGVVALALSRDGSRMALGKEDGSLQLRDPRTTEVVYELKAQDDAVTTLAFSSDGKRLATSGPDALVKVWDAQTGKLQHEFKGHTSWVYSLTFSRDGQYLASGAYDRSVRVWALRHGKSQELTGHRASVRSLTFSADGKLLLSGGTDKVIRVWDLATSTSKVILKGHEGGVRGLALADAGDVLYSAGEDGLIKRWDLKKGVETQSVKAVAEGQIQSLGLSPGQQVLVLGTEGGSLMVYDAATLKLHNARASVVTSGLMSLAFAPRAERLYALGGDGSVRLWHADVSPIRHLVGHKGPVRVAVFSPDGKLALSCGGWPQGDKTLRLWDVKTGKEIRTLLTAQHHVQSAAFTPDGKHALAGSDEGLVRMFDVTTGQLVRTYRGHKDGIPHLTVSADGKRFLSSGHDNTVRLWDVETGEAVRIFRGHTDWARVAAFLPDGQRIVTGGRDRTLRIWDVNDGRLLQTIEHQKEWVETIAVVPGGKQVLTAGGNNVHLWDLDTGKLVRSYTGHGFGVTSLALTRDGRTLLSSSYDGSIRAWEVASGQQLRQFQSHRDWVWSVALAPDGRHFLSAGGGGQVEGKYVAGQDFTIRLWALPAPMVTRAP